MCVVGVNSFVVGACTTRLGSRRRWRLSCNPTSIRARFEHFAAVRRGLPLRCSNTPQRRTQLPSGERMRGRDVILASRRDSEQSEEEKAF